MEDHLISLAAVLSSCHNKLLTGNVQNGMQELVEVLHRLRSSLPQSKWEDAISVCRQHPLCSVLHEDPLTQRSFIKPRGYAGDAVMLDMLYYGSNGHDGPSTEIGEAIFGYTAGSGRSPQAVRHRRSTIASYVNTITGCSRPRILSIASGYLREVELCHAFNTDRVEEWVAMDSDAQSVLECSRFYDGTCIRPVNGSVRHLLARKLDLGEFDFVYTTGLFDYLSDSVAKALISRMFEMLKPGGRLMVANLAADYLDAGYMEAFMDWRLIYRSKQEMAALFHILEGLAKNVEIFTDPMNAIVYATAQKQWTCRPQLSKAIT